MTQSDSTSCPRRDNVGLGTTCLQLRDSQTSVGGTSGSPGGTEGEWGEEMGREFPLPFGNVLHFGAGFEAHLFKKV